MAWKYRKRITIVPGVRLNLSRSGASFTVGPKGANINVGKRGTYLNMGIPGTGIYDRKKLSFPSSSKSGGVLQRSKPSLTPYPQYSIEKPKVALEYDLTKVESPNLIEIKQLINQNAKSTLEILSEKDKAKKELTSIRKKIKRFSLPLLKTLFKGNIEKLNLQIQQIETDLNTLQEDLEDLRVEMQFSINDPDVKLAFDELTKSFISLTLVEAIWDVVSLKVEINGATQIHNFDKRNARVSIEENSILKTESPVLFFENINGADLYFYISFLMLNSGDGNFVLIDYKDLNIEFSAQEFTLNLGSKIYSDAKVIGKTWMYTNKNGSPDGRRSFNPQLDIVSYGMITFSTKSGFKEMYAFSSEEVAENFYNSFTNFLNLIK